MKKGFIFRRAKPADLKNIQRLSRKLFRFEDRHFDQTLDQNWPFGSGKKFFKKKIAGRNHFAEVAETKNVMIGYLAGGIYKGIPWRQRGVYAELDNMFIESRFRGRGVGEKLVKDFLDWCRQKKVDFVQVTASSKNKNAIGFYRRTGFRNYALVLEMERPGRN